MWIGIRAILGGKMVMEIDGAGIDISMGTKTSNGACGAIRESCRAGCRLRPSPRVRG